MKVTITLEDDGSGAVDMLVEHDRKATVEELNRSMAARLGLGIQHWLKENAIPFGKVDGSGVDTFGLLM